MPLVRSLAHCLLVVGMLFCLEGHASAIAYRFDFVSVLDAAGSSTGLGLGDPYSFLIDLGASPVDTSPGLEDFGTYRAVSAAYLFPTGRFDLAPSDAADAQISVYVNESARDSLTLVHARRTINGSFNGEAATMGVSSQIAGALTVHEDLWLDDDLPPVSFLPIEEYRVTETAFFNLNVNGVTGDAARGRIVAATVIPEPSSTLLIAIGLCGLSRRAASRR